MADSKLEHQRDDARVAHLPVGELLKRVSGHAALLVRQELELAKAELGVTVARGKRAAIKATAAASVGYLGALALAAALILLLSMVMAPWLAAGLLGIALLVAGGVLGAATRKDVEQAGGVIPRVEQSLRRDMQAMKDAVR